MKKIETITIILLLAFLLYMLWEKFGKSLLKPATTGTTPVDKGELLKRGSTGSNVQLLQNKINEIIRSFNNRGGEVFFFDNISGYIGQPTITVDGIFGPETEQALIAVAGKNIIYAGEISFLSPPAMNLNKTIVNGGTFLPTT